MIRVPQVRVVDEDGAQLGVMPTPEALRLAQERGYDLVEVAPMATPPVVKFLDFGQYKYELTKREKEAKRKQRSVSFKEVRLKPKIGQGDFETKVRRAIEFLEEGDRVKVAVQFRGRELTHPEIGRNLLARFSEAIKDHGVIERAPLLEGKSMHITVASIHKPRAVEPTRAPEAARPAPAGAKSAAPVGAAGPGPAGAVGSDGQAPAAATTTGEPSAEPAAPAAAATAAAATAATPRKGRVPATSRTKAKTDTDAAPAAPPATGE